MNSNSHNRLLASQSSSFRQYAENYDEVIKICEEMGRKPAEVLRDAITDRRDYKRPARSNQCLEWSVSAGRISGKQSGGQQN